MTDITEDTMIAYHALAKVIASLNPAHYPKNFVLMLLVKNDIIFGQCTFKDRKEADEFFSIIEKDTSAKWGRILGEVEND